MHSRFTFSVESFSYYLHINLDVLSLSKDWPMFGNGSACPVSLRTCSNSPVKKKFCSR